MPIPSPYSSGTIQSPGGTIFRRTGGGGYDWALYYPQGTDWTYQVVDSYLNTDLTAEWMGLDAGKSFDSLGWAQARVDRLLVMQNRAGHDGNIYQNGDWLSDYHGVDEDIYWSNAAAWLQWWLMANGEMSPIGDHWGPVPVPEPGTCGLLGIGSLQLMVTARRRRG